MLGREKVVHGKKEEEGEEINVRYDRTKSLFANHK